MKNQINCLITRTDHYSTPKVKKKPVTTRNRLCLTFFWLRFLFSSPPVVSKSFPDTVKMPNTKCKAFGVWGGCR